MLALVPHVSGGESGRVRGDGAGAGAGVGEPMLGRRGWNGGEPDRMWKEEEEEEEEEEMVEIRITGVGEWIIPGEGGGGMGCSGCGDARLAGRSNVESVISCRKGDGGGGSECGTGVGGGARPRGGCGVGGGGGAGGSGGEANSPERVEGEGASRGCELGTAGPDARVGGEGSKKTGGGKRNASNEKGGEAGDEGPRPVAIPGDISLGGFAGAVGGSDRRGSRDGDRVGMVEDGPLEDGPLEDGPLSLRGDGRGPDLEREPDWRRLLCERERLGSSSCADGLDRDNCGGRRS